MIVMRCLQTSPKPCRLDDGASEDFKSWHERLSLMIQKISAIAGPFIPKEAYSSFVHSRII